MQSLPMARIYRLRSAGRKDREAGRGRLDGPQGDRRRNAD